MGFERASSCCCASLAREEIILSRDLPEITRLRLELLLRVPHAREKILRVEPDLE